MAPAKRDGVVLDSSFLIAYYNTGDVHHAAASRAMLQVAGGTWGPGLVLEYVFLEVETVILAKLGVARANEVGEVLLGAEELEFVPCSPVFTDALEIFRGQESGNLSFVDAAVAAVARTTSNGLVATFDRDFVGLRGIRVVPGA